MSKTKTLEPRRKLFSKKVDFPVSEDSVTKKVEYSGLGERKLFNTIEASGMAIILPTSFTAGLPIFNAMLASGPMQFAASLGVWGVANVGSWFAMRKISTSAMDQIILSQQVPEGTTMSVLVEAMEDTKKGRVLLNSFDIHEDVAIDITSWKDQSEGMSMDSPTHTINHYLIKEKGKYHMTQEAIINEEAMWDISADALVEVYGVQEKTESEKEMIA